MKTPPSKRKAWSRSNASSDPANECGTCGYRLGHVDLEQIDIVHGFARVDLVPDPSRPAISNALKARYGFAVGSGDRNSNRFDFGDCEYIGIRIAALRCGR